MHRLLFSHRFILLVSVIAIGALSLHFAEAWTNPGANPPGGTTYITTLPNGNVGIGTANPGAKLQVNGQVKITGGTPGAGKVLTSDASGLGSWQTPSTGLNGSGVTNYVSKFTGASTLGNSIIFDNGTNVGIGTAGPGQKLDVSGYIRGTGFCISGNCITSWPVDFTGFGTVYDQNTAITGSGDYSVMFAELSPGGGYIAPTPPHYNASVSIGFSSSCTVNCNLAKAWISRIETTFPDLPPGSGNYRVRYTAVVHYENFQSQQYFRLKIIQIQ